MLSETNGRFCFAFDYPETFLESGDEYESYLQQDPGLWHITESNNSPGSFVEGTGEDDSLNGWRVTVMSTDHVADPMMETPGGEERRLPRQLHRRCARVGVR